MEIYLLESMISVCDHGNALIKKSLLQPTVIHQQNDAIKVKREQHTYVVYTDDITATGNGTYMIQISSSVST